MAQKTSKLKSKRWKTALLVVAGLVLLAGGVFTALWPDAQAMMYNHGLQAYEYAQTAGAGASPGNPVKTPEDRSKMLLTAAKSFDFSVRLYKLQTRSSWLQLFFFPHPDQHLAAKASFRLGNCLTWMGKEKEAVAAYEQYLQLNPGGMNDKFALDTFAAQHNLELQFNHNPSLQQQEGKGKGKGKGDGDGQDKQQNPGDPSNQAGHQNPTKM